MIPELEQELANLTHEQLRAWRRAREALPDALVDMGILSASKHSEARDRLAPLLALLVAGVAQNITPTYEDFRKVRGA